MIIEDILSLDLHGKNIIIIGKPGSGKTWLSSQLDPQDFYTLHTDEYLVLGEPRAIHCLIEDAPIGFGHPFRIIEGMLGYNLLLEGYKSKRYLPDIVIICEISAGKQREVYLKERDASKIQYQKRFALKMQAILNEYHSLVPEEQKPIFYQFKNEYL